METTYGTIPSLSPTADAILVSAPTFAPSFKMLTRNYVRASISPFPIQQGQKLATIKFDIEVANNGLVNVPARAGRLLRACGFTETVENTATFTPVQATLNSAATPGPTVTWGPSEAGGSLSNTDPVTYTITVTTGGVLGTAQVSVVPNDPSLDTAQAGVVLASGAPLICGSYGLLLTHSWTGALVVGQQWFVTIYPPGVLYTPRSTGFESIGMQFYIDGSMHALAGAFGTVSMSATAGNFATLSFTFTGSYVPVVDATFPTPTFDSLNEPPLMQNACLAVSDSFQPVISSLTWDVKNKITTRTSANSPNGYLGVRITSRDPQGGIDPESVLVANHDFWGDLANAVSFPMSARFGSVPGNKVSFYAPAAQYTGLTYKDNNGIRNLNGALHFASISGDDEMSLFYY
jgi:hypothetical protein